MNFLREQWFVSLVLVIGISAGVWWLGPLLEIRGDSPWINPHARLATILVLVCIWGLNNLRLQLLERRLDQQLEEVIVAESGAFKRLDEVSSRISRALRDIRQERGFGSRYLRRVPWFLFVGAPGSGKTTALMNCGLDFPPSVNDQGRGVRGVGGTRNCEWLFARQAVLIDTAGRYLSQDSSPSADASEWQGFLRLVQESHEAGISGVLVVVSLQELINLKASERERYANAIRHRAQEIFDAFEMPVPVYVLLTKCDLLAGFRETFADLTAEERTDAWGFELEQLEAGDHWLEQFDSSFQDLINRVSLRGEAAMAHEGQAERRRRIFRFPQQLQDLRPALRHVLGIAFPKGPGAGRAPLRGVFLCSGTQQGTPIDRLLERAAQNLGLSLEIGEKRAKSRQSFFLTAVFQRYLIPEGRLRIAGFRYGLRTANLQLLAFAGSFLLLAILAAMLVAASILAWDIQGKARNIVAELPPLEAPSLGSALEAMRRLDHLHVTVSRDLPVPGGVQNHLLGGLREAVQQHRQRRLEQQLLPALAETIRQHAEDNSSAAAWMALSRPELRDSRFLASWLGRINSMNQREQDRVAGWLSEAFTHAAQWRPERDSLTPGGPG